MRAQISVEFLMLFTLALLVFITAATYFPQQVQAAQQLEQGAERALEEIKLHTITASTTTQEYRASIPIPTTIRGEQVTLVLIAGSDNLAIIKHTNTQRTLASTQLPDIDDITEEDIKTVDVKWDGVSRLTLIVPNDGTVEVIK